MSKDTKSVVHELFGRANAALDAGKYDEAIDLMTRAIAADPRNPALIQSRGTVHALKDDQEAAIADYSAAIALHPRYADAHLNRGLAQWEEKHFEEAVDDLTKALDLGLRFEELTMQARYFRARSLEELGDLQNAYDAYLEIAVLAPNSAYANNCAERALAIKELEDAGIDTTPPPKPQPRAEPKPKAPAKRKTSTSKKNVKKK